MICKLAPHEYPHVRPLFGALDYHLAVDAIIAGDAPAQVYADDPLHPRVALFLPWNPHRIYLAGAVDNAAFNRAAAAVVMERYATRTNPAAPAEPVVYFAPGWEQSIDAILPGATTVKCQRQFLRLKRLQSAWRAPIPAGFTMRRVDAGLLAERLRHTEYLVEEIHSESHSVDDFLRNEFGYCVQHGDALVGWCLSEYNRPGRCELGIETLEGYRRRGIATLTASAVIEHALAQEITGIGWHCWASNTASIAVATKLGFEKVLDYLVWYCRMGGSSESA